MYSEKGTGSIKAGATREEGKMRKSNGEIRAEFFAKNKSHWGGKTGMTGCSRKNKDLQQRKWDDLQECIRTLK